MRKGLAGLLAAGGLTAGALSGCISNKTLNSRVNDALNTGYKIGYRSGLEKGLDEGYAGAAAYSDPWVLPDVDGSLLKGGVNVMFDGHKYENYIKGRMTPPDVQIVCDLRGIAEPKLGYNENNKFWKRDVQNLIWREGLPKGAVAIYTSEEGKRRWDQEERVQNIMGRIVPASSNYPIIIVPHETLGKIDYSEKLIRSRRPGSYEFIPGHLTLPETLPAETTVTNVPEDK